MLATTELYSGSGPPQVIKGCALQAPETPRVDFVVAYALVSGLIQRRLAEAGVRVLFIKGPFPAQQGLRPPKISVDIDLLVPPDEVDLATEVVAGDGWYRRDAARLRVAHEKHSETLLHPFWPNMIDLHRFWTGFIGDRDQIFDLLWNEREERRHECLRASTTEPRSSALLLALHDIRSHGVRDLDSRLDRLASRCRAKWGPETGALLMETAVALGAEHTAEPFLRRLGVEVPKAAITAELHEWEMQLRSGGRSVEGWQLRFREAPLLTKPAVVLDALALRPGQLRALRPQTPPGVLAFWRAWFERLRQARSWSRQRRADRDPSSSS